MEVTISIPLLYLIQQSQKKILKDETSIKINKLLKKIVESGTGKKAKVKGLEVGGKTGTSRKLEEGKYSEKKSYYFLYRNLSHKQAKIYCFCSF